MNMSRSPLNSHHMHIPSEFEFDAIHLVSLFHHLEYLNLGANAALSGTIPSELGSLANLGKFYTLFLVRFGCI